MGKHKPASLFRKLHKWPGIIIALIAILFAASGIVLNHRQTFSNIDIPRKLLPPNYRYKNWNLAAVRGSLQPGNNSLLIYGNIGIWKSGDDPNHFVSFNQGFPKGMDHRRVYSVVDFNNDLYAGTHFGLYCRTTKDDKWHPVSIPVKKRRIADLAMKGDTLLVLTRDYLLKTTDGKIFETVMLPEPEGYVRKTSIFTTLWELHSGELLGLTGKLLVDLLGLVTILLSVTGLLHFLFPKIIQIRKRKQKQFTVIIRAFRSNQRWHNVTGYIFVFFLILNTLAGIHLRPPLLIPVANKKMGIIPGTHLDNPNPWFDKLRRIIWDPYLNRYILSTADGFFSAEETLTWPVQRMNPQPPVSIMGLNVFQPSGEGIYLAGSFNGIFRWDVRNESVNNYLTGISHSSSQKRGSPVGADMAAGWVTTRDHTWWFDYNRGALPLSGMPFPEMPREILSHSPMSLWNLSLEIHTGRIFEHLTGPWYILYVPLSGLCLIVVLLSGFLTWWKIHRSKRSKQNRKIIPG